MTFFILGWSLWSNTLISSMIIADATQVFGGRALTVTGMGKYIENVSALLVLYFHSVRHLWSWPISTRGPTCEPTCYVKHLLIGCFPVLAWGILVPPNLRLRCEWVSFYFSPWFNPWVYLGLVLGRLWVLICLHLRLIVLAGAEDVLGDLGVRQALKRMPKDARL